MATTNNILETAIGKGAFFPITLTDNGNGKMTWAPINGDIKLIKHSLTSIIEYCIGFRIRNESFGTRLMECLEEPDTQALDYLVKLYITQAINYWETRVKILDIRITHSSSYIINMSISLQVILTQSVESLDFSFNLQNQTINVSQ